MVFRLTTFTIKNDSESLKFTDEGYLQVTAYATRTGVFEYLLPNGSVFREYRPPEEVFKPESLDTLKNKPITRLHPRTMLDSTNVSKHIKGITLTDVEREGDLVKVSSLIYDSDLIHEITTRKMEELSCGYHCELEHVPGITPTGEQYDAIQRNIKQNHLAVVPKGRAGPEARLKLDARFDSCYQEDDLDNSNTDIKEKTKEQKTMEITINNKKFDVNDDVAEKVQSEVKALETKIDQTQAALDIEKARKAETPVFDDAVIESRIVNKMALITKVSKVLDSKTFKADDAIRLTDRQLKELAVKKKFPNIEVKDRSEEYLQALYDSIDVDVQETKEDVKQNDTFQKLLSSLSQKEDADEDEDPADKARNERLKKMRA